MRPEEYLMSAPGAVLKDMPIEVKVVKTGPVIYHKIGLTEVIISTKDGDNVNYRSAGAQYQGNKAVLEAVEGKLSDLGLQCAIEEKHNRVACQGDFKEPVDAQTLAIFFRLLVDADLASGAIKVGAAKKIATHAWKKAEDITNDLSQMPWTDIPKIKWDEILK